MSGANLPDQEYVNYLFQNIKPPKMGNKGPFLNESLVRNLRIMDEQNAVNAGEWFNLPVGLSANLIERILYYRGSGMFFYMKENNQFYFLPYVGMDLDVYGRYVSATALPFNGTAADTGKKEAARPWIEGKYWTIAYDIAIPGELKLEDFTGKCVVLNDYSRQMSQKVLPRQTLQEPLIQVEAEIVPFMRTALLNNSGVDGVRVQNNDEAYSVQQASNGIVKAALGGDRWIPIEAGLQLESLSRGSQGKCEEYLLALQSLDNLRLAMHGLDAGGLFEKKAHMLESEQAQQASSASLVEADKTYQRQEFCNIVNSIWGLGMWYEPSEIVKNIDRDGNGEMENSLDASEGQGSFEESAGAEE